MSYKNYNDYELIYMVRENDEWSYNILFQKYLPIIRKIAFDYYKGYSSYGYDIDDFIQEGYLGFQQALKSYDENKNILFYTFVSLCIQRKIISFCKKISNDKKNISNKNTVDLDEVSIVDNKLLIDEYFSKRDFIKCIWDVIYTFPFEYTCVFELRMNQFQYLEIEKLLGVSVRRAEFMVHRIQKKIRKEFTINM